MQVTVWLLVLVALLWIVALLIHAIRINSTTLSPFELKRRVADGDSEARRIEDREQVLPRVRALRRIVETLFVVVAVVLTIEAFGWMVGLVVAVLLALMMDSIARLVPVVRLAAALYVPREPQLLAIIAGWRWLDWFRGVLEERAEYVATSKAELQHIVESSAAVLTRDELLRFQAGLAFDIQTARDVMTPISVVDIANVADSLGPLVLDDLHRTGHSRFPVIDGDVHHVVGILYLHDIINLKSAKPTVKEAMDPRVHYIHESQSLEHALNGFLKSHHHLFVVVNDYRETVGILTLEDVLEALLGKKIIDEFDHYEDLRAVAASNPRKNNLPKGKTDI